MYVYYKELRERSSRVQKLFVVRNEKLAEDASENETKVRPFVGVGKRTKKMKTITNQQQQLTTSTQRQLYK